ncbi:hypothetical protein Droror1_Dr00010924 [Drosera rotundifolia]
MEAQQQGVMINEDQMGITKSSYLCRQSSTRWTPTTDQIRILKELYYNNGVRSPSADQIQRISARLRQYGKIEGKNVFYWFQNHKARERQKKRFNVAPSGGAVAGATNGGVDVNVTRQSGHGAWKTEDSSFSKYPCGYTTTPAGFGYPSSSSSSSAPVCPSVVPVGNVVGGGGFAYGAVAMERNFRECSISAGPNGQNIQWAAAAPNPQSYYFFDKKSSTIIIDEGLDEEELYQDHQLYDDKVHELETLPLFPMRDEDSPVTGFFDNNFRSSEMYYGGGCHWSGGGGDSLELSLNSFMGNSVNF